MAKSIPYTILKLGSLISTYGFILSVIIQVFARFFLPSAPSWTEEASRLFFVYSISFSLGLAYLDGEFISIDWLFNKLPKKWQGVISFSIDFISFILFSVIFYYSLKFTHLGHSEFSPGMRINMSYAFISISILSASLCYYIFEKLLFSVNNRRRQ